MDEKLVTILRFEIQSSAFVFQISIFITFSFSIFGEFLLNNLSCEEKSN